MDVLYETWMIDEVSFCIFILKKKNEFVLKCWVSKLVDGILIMFWKESLVSEVVDEEIGLSDVVEACGIGEFFF